MGRTRNCRNQRYSRARAMTELDGAIEELRRILAEVGKTSRKLRLD
jgi:hypothetical protein